MSFQAMTWATEQKLPAKEKLVLLMLANCHNHHTNRCDPSHARLAEECGMSISSVKRAIAELEKKNLLTITNRKVGDVNLPNSYSFNFGWVGSDRPEVGSDRPEGSVHSELQTRNINQEYNNTLVDDDIDHEELEKPKLKKQSIPYQQIVDLYNKICGEVLPKCLTLDAKRKNNISKCWNLVIDGERPFRDMGCWEGYFYDCLQNQHWTGNNDRGWKANIEFITRPDSVLKIVEPQL